MQCHSFQISQISFVLKIYMCLHFQVSWIRKRDLHILTMGSALYSNDKRIQVIHPKPSQDARNNNRDDWLLNIHEASPEDSGIYECQINTEPKKSKAYMLKVVGKLSFPNIFTECMKCIIP